MTSITYEHLKLNNCVQLFLIRLSHNFLCWIGISYNKKLCAKSFKKHLKNINVNVKCVSINSSICRKVLTKFYKRFNHNW